MPEKDDDLDEDAAVEAVIDGVSGKPLTARELKVVRIVVRDWERKRWFKREGRRVLGYGAAGIAALYASWDVLGRIIGALVQAFRGGPPQP